METRKVQITGGSTFVVSLPKSWAKDVGVKQNDTLGFIPQHDGTLLITPKIVKGREERKKVFSYNKDEDREKILRDLIGAYMMGYDVIEIRVAPRMPTDIRHQVRTFTQLVIGPEIVDETMSTALTKDLLDPSDLSFGNTIRREHRIVEEMLRNAIVALVEGDEKLARDVMTRDGEVDRLNWLVARQYNLLIRDIRLAEGMDTTRERAINYLFISRLIERIGDHGTKIAENVAKLSSDKRPSKKQLKEVEAMGQTALDLLSKAISSLYKKDSEASNQTIGQVNEFVKVCDDFDDKLARDRGESAIALTSIVESIRRVALYSRDISESVINYLVDLE